ncbi:MAG: DUF92 domain-containing protein [Melioribacteraceae bacterium]|nr:DUF92 domain-containing protein [Melioribacteraceae bacterium]
MKNSRFPAERQEVIISLIALVLAFTALLVSKRSVLFNSSIVVFVLTSINYIYIIKRKENPNKIFLKSLLILFLVFTILLNPLFELSSKNIFSAFLITAVLSFSSGITKCRSFLQNFNSADFKDLTYGFIKNFSIIVLLLILLDLFLFPDVQILIAKSYIVKFAFLITVGAAITSAVLLSDPSSEKFTIPLISFIFVYIYTDKPDFIIPVITGFFAAAVIALVSYRVKFLTLNGSIATFLLAGFIFGLGGWKWSIPILSFFILSSILSKIRKQVHAEIEGYFEKSGVRDYLQVFANGGLGGILVVVNFFYPEELFYAMYLASLAAVCADTWATEIGTLKKTSTYNILNFKKVEQGVSGGISVAGTLGAFAGALTIYLSGILWIETHIFENLIFVLLAGVGGSLFDSLLGATIQVQYICASCERLTEKTEHCNVTSRYYRGLTWMNNDTVNLFASFAGIFIIVIINLFRV